MEESPSLLDAPGEGDDPSYVSANGDAEIPNGDGTTSIQQTNFGVPGSIPTEGTRPRKKRGRHAKDPLAQTVQFQCLRSEDLESSLRDYLANPTHPAEHTTLEFVFPVTAAFMIPAREVLGGGDPNDKKTPFTYSLFKKSAVSVVDALHNMTDAKEQMITQKRISKSLVDAISEIDGFHYSFHNYWLSNADQANRFSYYCNDSILNKGRAANEGLSKIRDSVKIRKPVYECEGGIWIKFSMTKNNLELHYKHIPMHPTFDERAPIPRNGSRRRKLMEIFHPEKLPTPKEKAKKDKPPKAATKRKSTGDPSAPSRKRRATEPPRVDDSSAPQSARERESSLQPLFDFLGSAGRLDEVGAELAGPETPVRSTDSAPPALGESGVDAPVPSNATNSRKNKDQPYPGMMSGFMNNGEEIQWGDKTKPKKKPARKSKGKQGEQDTAALPVPTESASLPPPIPQGNGPTLVPANSTEMDALRRRLIEAEEKIRLLESQNSQPQQVSRPVNQQYQAAPPFPPPPQPFYPPQQHHPPPPGPWQHPSLYPYHPPYNYPGHQGPPGPPPVPARGPLPMPAPAATHPHAYQQLPALPPPVQSKAAPSYGFVPNPADIIATKIRPHLTGPQMQNMPGPIPVRQAPLPAHNHNYLSQLHQAASSPRQAGIPSQPQSQSQTQPQVPAQPQLQGATSGVVENPTVLNGAVVEGRCDESSQAGAEHESHPQAPTSRSGTQAQNGEAESHSQTGSQDANADDQASNHPNTHTGADTSANAPSAEQQGPSSRTSTPVSGKEAEVAEIAPLFQIET
ncbi:hypothetical protein H2200_007771 [Cladophialophora chaetospira]|uniref:Uncharacterized protein n=1 Tax=Cladophialophora chaetospira TaxID=386627 RepID=A0AA39CGW8_9EURO|nr:hypothetical protein H2200_007771 [Cladophialophora chaetospira]